MTCGESEPLLGSTLPMAWGAARLRTCSSNSMLLLLAAEAAAVLAAVSCWSCAVVGAPGPSARSTMCRCSRSKTVATWLCEWWVMCNACACLSFGGDPQQLCKHVEAGLARGAAFDFDLLKCTAIRFVCSRSPCAVDNSTVLLLGAVVRIVLVCVGEQPGWRCCCHLCCCGWWCSWCVCFSRGAATCGGSANAVVRYLSCSGGM